MKAMLLNRPRDLLLKDIPVPTISDNEILVEVKFCGICGTDIHSVSNCKPYRAGTYLGHEFSAIIVEVGKNVIGCKVGDRVVVRPRYMCGRCWACLHGRQSLCVKGFEHGIGLVPGLEFAGGFAKFVRVSIPEWRLLHLPEEISFEEGALIEPLACSLHALRVSAFRPREHVMVLGAGMIGLGVIAHLRNAGAGLIIVTEINEIRADMAKKFGADFVFDPRKGDNLKKEVIELTGGEGVAVVFDCSGVTQAFASATDFLRVGGQIVLEGVIEAEVPIVPMSFTFNEWELKGSVASYADEFPMVIEFLRSKVAPVRDLITSKVELEEAIGHILGELMRPQPAEIKVLVSPE